MGSKEQTVLVVDDEENARLGLSRLLTRDGYQVKSASSSEEALEILGQHQISLVISDINMPGMNGMALLRELNRRHPETAVIMLTAFGEIESYIDAMNLGAFEYLHKPIRSAELKSVLVKIFPNKEKQGRSCH